METPKAMAELDSGDARDDGLIGEFASDPFEPRRLTASDAAAAAAVIRIAFAEQGAVTTRRLRRWERRPRSSRTSSRSGGGAGLEYEGGLIGVVLWTPQEDALYLGRLAVSPAWRGRGLAGRLIDAAEAEARRRGSSCCACTRGSSCR